MNKNTVKRSCTAGIPDFLPRQKDQKNQVHQKEVMWPEINPWNVMFSVLGVCAATVGNTLSNQKNHDYDVVYNYDTKQYEFRYEHNSYYD
ncbi:hypothetical protein GVC69_004658 [Salmonella enterica]|nr:hypothetical protein [Salmonella enterica]ECD6766719.1 hypothetical protein [Salmonella enterica subsp. enterica serovar Newport]EEJ3970380.1 hypothetical protein [Salmonella enterica subsp. enterica serovar Gatuni]EHC5874278.1 hypothetical protein [Salmonella enterica subsp. enterica serovar Eastbourne]ECR5067251.1 hypothetical protein [Salmonella enterica]